ncbi:hypothetical protein ABH926_010347 [Catenulispora sp. GP43]|uniref:hypothetical protein n=1 Tax=Catenulispora sp. GP43 TaxID=3156263 RepID=UPI0035131760
MTGRTIEVHEVFAADWSRLAGLLADFLEASPASAASLARRSRLWPDTVIADLREQALLLTNTLEGTQR